MIKSKLRHVFKKASRRRQSLAVMVTVALAALSQPMMFSGALCGAAQAQAVAPGRKPLPVPASPHSPSAARLESSAASGYDGGTLIEWRTGFEVDNLGFRLYRDEGRKRTLLTPQLLAGSALVTRQGTALAAGRSYAWWDSEIADCGLRIADCRKAVYWLEELDLKGNSIWHGPIAAQAVGGAPPEPAKVLMLAGLGLANSASRPVEARAGSPRAPLVKPATAVALAGQAAVKISIDHEGWYHVTQAELLAAGLDPQTDPRKLQLYVDGQSQAISVIGENDGHLDATDAVEFYATGMGSPFSNRRVYWLAAGAQAGSRIATVQAPTLATTGGAFAYTVERRDRTIHYPALLNGDAENFFGAVISNQPTNQSLGVPHLDAAMSGATLEVALQGVTQIAHLVNVRLNGTDLGNQSYSGQANQVASYSVPAFLLQEGQNTVTLVGQNGSSDISLVDYLRLTYDHTYTADDDRLKLTAQAGQPLTVNGFSNSAVRVFDITDAAAVQEIIGQVQSPGASYSVSLVPSGAGQRTLLALTASQAGAASQVAANLPSTWSKTAQGADLLIITRRDFFSAVDALRVARQRQGLSVAVVDVEDLYDEFSYGQKTPQAIKDFLSLAATSWKKKPRYVLLVGDASFDPKNYLGYGDFDLLPTKLVDDSFQEAASDDWYADFDGDGVPEMAVGRLPVRTADEAARMIARVFSYEAAGVPNEMLLVADSNDDYDFAGASNQLHSLVSNDVRVVDVQRGALGDAATKAAVLAAIARGQRLVNYVGHGSTNLWRGNTLTNADAATMENADRLPVFLMMTCLNGYFNDPAADALAEALLKAPRGGAVAVWAASGQTLPQGQWQMNQELYRQVFSTRHMRLGDAARAAKQGTTDADVRRTWILFGDPTMRLK
ncbi:MAG TPA: C25 family cysteine peptidase [Blastocatellia bacterium]